MILNDNYIKITKSVIVPTSHKMTHIKLPTSIFFNRLKHSGMFFALPRFGSLIL